jgi:predicted nucleotidyltransferase
MFCLSNMRFHDTLDDVLGNPVRVRLLRILTRNPAQGCTGRDLARRCAISPSQTIAALEQLESSGVVFREVAGRSHVWRLSREHVLVPMLTSLFQGERESLETLRVELKGAIRNLPVEHAWIFGSVARGDERPTSDVDFLVQVRTRGEKERVEASLSAISAQFALRYGNPLSTLVVDPAGSRRPSNPGLLERVLKEGVEVLD